MKITLRKTLLLFCSTLLMLTSCKDLHMENENEEREEEEGIPGVIMSMNEWSAARSYPNKKLVAEGFNESHLQMKRMAELQRTARGAQATALTNWTALAPMNFAGRVISLAFHPTNPNIMWAGSASGGLWKTTNGGTSATTPSTNWSYVPTGFPVLGVGAIAINPNDGNEIYAGTGEVYDNGSGGAGGANVTSGGFIRTYRGSYGIGIIKSTDGGVNWTKTLDFSYSSLKGVADIVIDPTKPDTVYAATSDGVYRTFNGGANWTLIHSVVMASDLCFKPGDYSVMYVGCGNFGSPGYGIYKSVDVNATTPTFTKLAGGLPTGLISGKIQLAISPSNPSRVYASIGKAPGTTDIFALYHSANEGATWTQKATAATIFAGSSLNQGWYAHDVAVSPTNADSVYCAEMELFVSTNGGGTWPTTTPVPNGAKKSVWSGWNVNQTVVGTTAEGNTNYVHADIHHVYISPFDTKTIWCVTDGGVFKSTNSGNNWISCNGGLMTVQIYPNMGMSTVDPNFMIGGMQDNEGFIYANANGCKRIPNLGDGFHSAITPGNDLICFTSSYYFNLRKSTDKGVSWGNIGTANSGIPPAENACFNSPFILAPSLATTMYGGTIYFKRSLNSGTAWTNMNGGAVLVNASAPILYMAVAQNDDKLVYVSTAPGGGVRSKLWKTTDGGATFTEITGTLPDRYYSDIAIDPANNQRIAVTLSGFGSSHVYLSNDAGASWIDIGAYLVDVPANTAIFDQSDPGILYVGNDLGIFAANRLPTTGYVPWTSTRWLNYSSGFTDAVMVSDLVITPGATPKLRAGTFGRGLWENAILTNAAFSVLPVTMKSFTGKNTGALNNLEWNTSSESAVKSYEVEYSSDGVHFTKVGQVAAKNSARDATYTFTHTVTNYATSAYYRIKSVDIDGIYQYSNIVELQISSNKERIYLYPNPAREAFKIHLPSSATGLFNVVITDQGGRVVKTAKVTVIAGTEIRQEIHTLAAGTYHVTLENKSVKWNGSLIKQK